MQGVFDFRRDQPVRPERPERLFFALFSDSGFSTQAEEIGEQVRRENHLRGKPLKAERLHVSLHHVGDYKRLPSGIAYAATQAGSAVSLRPFEVTFRYIMGFESAPAGNGRPRRCPLALLAEGDTLLELHRSLGVAMERNGLKAVEHFMPHMTLSYGDEPFAMRPIEPIRFVAREFTLVHSRLWLSQYSRIDRWPLSG